MPKKPTLEARVIAQTNAGELIEELLAQGLSIEMVAVRMGEFLSGAHPSVQSLHRWKAKTSNPSRANGAALALLHEEVFGEKQ